jgi:hypothetical protein
LGELDLELAFEAAGALREDVEDQTGAIENATLQERFQVAFLAGRQRMVENDEIGLLVANESADFFCFARADIQPRIGRFAGACDDAQNVRACGSSKGIELVQLILFWCMSQSDPNQERAFTTAGTFKQY